MRFLANENFPLDAIEALRQAGHDVLWIRTNSPGSRDQEVLARADAEERILFTFYKDFGELAFRYRLPASCGIVLFQLQASTSEFVARLVISALQTDTEWMGHFTVVEMNRGSLGIAVVSPTCGGRITDNSSYTGGSEI